MLIMLMKDTIFQNLSELQKQCVFIFSDKFIDQSSNTHLIDMLTFWIDVSNIYRLIDQALAGLVIVRKQYLFLFLNLYLFQFQWLLATNEIEEKGKISNKRKNL
eukprot:TRINITY_DN4088_c2_g1_i4.p9 TRINITY_DN4088_c2_g1~~TRINITY_DN4088_c2_g1_i4.p9  ORF type:complete len:104 (-),score=4.50 TRINITY_DN4088_c2_g1_i4:242-553(-)